MRCRALSLVPLLLVLGTQGCGKESKKDDAEPTEARAASAFPEKTPKPDVETAPATPSPIPSEAATSDTPSEKERGSPQTPPTDAPRVYAKSRHVWIRSLPRPGVQWVGFLWWGGSVKIREGERVPGGGCPGEWVPVEPRGWVCVDGKRATTDPKDETLLALYPHRGRTESAWPHRYAEVHAPVRKYASLTALDPRSEKKLPLELPPLPNGLSEGRRRIAARSAMAFSDSYTFGDKKYLLAADLGWVEEEKVELLDPSHFHGVELGEKFQLPLAFFRGKERPGFKKLDDGSFEEVPESFKRLEVVQLEEEFVEKGRTRYYRVKGQDLWVSSQEAVVPRPREKTPWGAPIGEPDETGRARKGRATWLEGSILGGWLVAFEGTTPKYATMISAGRGGTPHGDRDPLETASTPTGWFPIGGKFRTATMDSSSTDIVHQEVPWTQNFSGPHAIHSAYWHDDWGTLKSAGCVNIAPLDGKWLFEFTEPEVPEGWHGVRYVARYGGGSTLFIVHE